MNLCSCCEGYGESISLGQAYKRSRFNSASLDSIIKSSSSTTKMSSSLDNASLSTSLVHVRSLIQFILVIYRRLALSVTSTYYTIGNYIFRNSSLCDQTSQTATGCIDHTATHSDKERAFFNYKLNDVPEHLRFNPFILEGYRPNLDFKQSILSFFYIHNESTNIYSHAFALIYFLFFMPKYLPWSVISSSYLCLFFAISHVFSTVAPWLGSTIYHLFMNHRNGQEMYNKLLAFNVLGIWITQTFGALLPVYMSVIDFNFTFRYCYVALYVLLAFRSLYDVLIVGGRMRRRFVISENKNDQALRLQELYFDLKSSGRISQPVSLMIFFYTLCQASTHKKGDSLNLLKSKFLLPNSVRFPGLFKENRQPAAHFASSSSHNDQQQLQQQLISLTRKHESQNQLLRSYMDSFSAFTNQYVNSNLINHHQSNMPPANYQFNLNQMSHYNPSANQFNQYGGSNGNLNEPVLRKQTSNNKQPRPFTIHVDNTRGELNSYVSNAELFRELLLAFQGYTGRILEQSSANDYKYRINAKYKVDPTIKCLVLRLSNIGWMFFKINKYCEHVAKNESVGHVCKSFVFALQDELNSYLKLVTIIEQQFHFSIINNLNSKSEHSPSHSFLRLQMVTYDSFNGLKSLASLIDHCKNKRGGELINTVYKCIQQGDPLIRNMMTKLLTSILIPLRKFLSNWLFYGELDDPYKEFFITNSRNGSSTSPFFWHERYSINEHMLPGFITVEQAQKVLATGKAVNVLKQISDSTKLSINYFEKMKSAFESSSIEELFNESFSYNKSYFQKQLSLAYKETNQNALKLLNEEYNFHHHLEGLKLFLLLGQGDFIRHLMDLLQPILDKPAKQLRNHKLTNLLSSAIRSTNAQYLIDDVIDRLDIRFQEKAIEETGWDIFSLVYKTKGPISIVFTNQCMENYSILFKYLWRSKRMEYILTSLLEKRLVYNRNLKRMPELKSVFHLSNILLTEMVHFIKQMQYYLKFEVIECSWVVMQKRIAEAEDIDQLIKAQEDFLTIVIHRTMLDSQSKVLSTQLRAIYDTIIDFQNIQNDLFGQIECEKKRRDQFKQYKLSDSDKQSILEEYNKQNDFKSITLSNIKVKVQSLSKTYENMVQKFLILLAEHCESDLRCLSVRLDFNEHYKKRNKSLECSFTYKMIRD